MVRGPSARGLRCACPSRRQPRCSQCHPPIPPPHTSLVVRLSQSSTKKHFDAYRDVDWDAPNHRVDPEDPRWEKDEDDPLGATEWYRSLPQATRARLGLHHIACQMKMGIAFEAVLGRGLLEFANKLPNGAPEFRYAYHEIVEEAQHSMMFQEFVNRSGFDVRGLSGLDAFGARFVPSFGRRFPELCFVFVLGGEAPIDWVQRRTLARSQALDPLLRRIMQIHVTEEARHLSFAKSFLADRVPKLGSVVRFQLRVRAPFVLAASSRAMLVPPNELVKAYRIPAQVVREAYLRNQQHRQRVIDSLESVRMLCHKIGLLTPRNAFLWRSLGVAAAKPCSPPIFASLPRGIPSRLAGDLAQH